MKISVTVLGRHWAAGTPVVLFTLQTTRNGKPIVLGVAVTLQGGRIYSVGTEVVEHLPNNVTARSFADRVESAANIALALLNTPWPGPEYRRINAALVEAVNPAKEHAR